MTEQHGLSKANLLRVLPEVLQQDTNMEAIAEAIAEVLAGRVDEIAELEIYTRIGELPEDLLDILAVDYHVDWWDYEYTLEQKRETLKASWYTHRHLGTKSAVLAALRSAHPDTNLTEWFEYDGSHHRFRIQIESPGMDGITRALDKIYIVKRLSAWLDGIEARHTAAVDLYIGEGILTSKSITYVRSDQSLYLPVILLDEDETILTDENGDILCEEYWADEDGTTYSETEVR